MMKTISKLFGAVAAIAALAACNKEVAPVTPVVPEGMQKMEIKVNTGATKVACDGLTGNLSWETGDKIAVIFDNGAVYCFELESVADGKFVSYEVPAELTLYEVTDIYYPYVDTNASSYPIDLKDVLEVQDNLANGGSFDKSTFVIPLHWRPDYSLWYETIEDGVTLYADHTAMFRVPASDFENAEGEATVTLYTVEEDISIEEAEEYATYTIINVTDGDDLVFFVNIDLPDNFGDDTYRGIRIPYVEVNGKQLRITEFGWGHDNPNSWAIFPSLPDDRFLAESNCYNLDDRDGALPCRYLVRDYILFNLPQPVCFFKTNYNIDIFSDEFTWKWLLDNDPAFSAIFTSAEELGQMILCYPPDEWYEYPLFLVGENQGELFIDQPVKKWDADPIFTEL